MIKVCLAGQMWGIKCSGGERNRRKNGRCDCVWDILRWLKDFSFLIKIKKYVMQITKSTKC